MAATFIAPELELAQEEAKELTAALAEVNSFYSQVVDPKVIAWMGLIGVAGKIYGPRVGAFMLRRKLEAVQPQRRAPLAGNAPAQSAEVPKKVTPQIVKTFVDPAFVSMPTE